MNAHGLWRALAALLVPLLFTFVARAQSPQTDAAARIAANQRTEAKLEKIVIPHAKFVEATLPEAIEDCRRQGVLLDKSERQQAQRGLKIVIDPRALAPKDQLTNERITVELTNAPLGAVLGYVTNLMNTRFRVTNGVVVVVPAEVPDPIMTREWKISAKWLARARLSPGDRAAQFEPRIDPPGDRDLKEGTPSVVVSPDGKRLIGKGTEGQLDFIDTLLKSS